MELPKDIIIRDRTSYGVSRYKVSEKLIYKELERLVSVNKIGMSVDKVLDAAKTITTIRVRLPENRTTFTKTLFLTEKHLAVKPLFDQTNSES